MNLNEDDIRSAILNYQKTHNKSGKKMTELCGMSSTSMYSQYQSGVTKTIRAEYVLNFLMNTGLDLTKFLSKNFRRDEIEVNKVEEPLVKTYSCPDCIAKQKEIDALNKALEAKEELLEMYREKKSEGKCG